MDTECLGTNKDGSPCSAAPRASGYCLWHDPALMEQRAAWRSMGGANRSNRTRAGKRLAMPGVTTQELQHLVGQALKDVIAGELPPAVGNCVANLARALVAVREATELEERLAALEASSAGLSETRRPA